MAGAQELLRYAHRHTCPPQPRCSVQLCTALCQSTPPSPPTLLTWCMRRSRLRNQLMAEVYVKSLPISISTSLPAHTTTHTGTRVRPKCRERNWGPIAAHDGNAELACSVQG